MVGCSSGGESLHWRSKMAEKPETMTGRVSIELSDRFEISDTIHSQIKKLPVNAGNSHE